MDGIKTGFTNASGYNLMASAERNGRRVIAIMMGGSTGRSRDAHVADLLEAAFLEIGGGSADDADLRTRIAFGRPWQCLLGGRSGAMAQLRKLQEDDGRRAGLRPWIATRTFVADADRARPKKMKKHARKSPKETAKARWTEPLRPDRRADRRLPGFGAVCRDVWFDPGTNAGDIGPGGRRNPGHERSLAADSLPSTQSLDQPVAASKRFSLLHFPPQHLLS